MSETFDNQRALKPSHILDVDKAFYEWWDLKLNLHVTDDGGNKKKVPVTFVSPERWHIARENGIRDSNGTIILPIIAISRTKVGGPNEGSFGRIVADTKQPIAYHKRISPKSSLVKELVKNRKWTVDPSLPIYEVFTSNVADHMLVQYEVAVWTQYIDEMSDIIEKVGQEYDYLSVKSFVFDLPNGFYHVAYQDDDLTDESNTDDYTDSERLIRRNIIYNVPVHIIPDVDNKKSKFRRYLTQSKIVFKNETVMSIEDYRKLFE